MIVPNIVKELKKMCEELDLLIVQAGLRSRKFLQDSIAELLEVRD